MPISKPYRLQLQPFQAIGPLLLFIILCVFIPTSLLAKEYSFVWSENPDPVLGYKIHYKKGGDAIPPFDGSDANEGASPIDVGTATNFTISGLEDNTTYHFSLTAYDSDGEGPFSDIITVFPVGAVPVPPEEPVDPPEPPIISPPIASEGSHNFTFTWSYEPTADITAYRFYLNDAFLCESTTLSANSTTCSTDIINGVMNFTMTTLDSTGTESSPSNVLTFDPADYPESFVWKTATFTWEFAENDITINGFKILNNNKVICETDNPVLRELECTFLITATNNFSVLAVTADGALTTESNTLTYIEGTTEEPPSPPSTQPAAIISVTNQVGTAPLTVTFDGSSSTGTINSYAWTFGDSETGAGPTTSYTYNFPGVYTATLTVLDSSGLSSSAEVVITAEEPDIVTPPATEPPTPVISSSSGIGEAPFTVEFNGSDSTTKQPPITLFEWNFGDGSSATGAATAHTYTIAGTYEARLTVTDSAGLQGQITTPIIINPPPPTPNQTPISTFSATPVAGVSPLTVAFDASASSDPDGTITDYMWSFGDGNTTSGKTALHSYTDIANYTVVLKVTDDKADNATSSKGISVFAPENPEFYFELWEVQVDQEWTNVTFEQPFIDPVIVSGPPGSNEPDPVVTRIRNITSSGFEIRLQEWDYLDGTHVPETLSFLVIEKGTHVLDDGTMVEAGTFIGNATTKTVSLQQAFIDTPVILTQVISDSSSSAVTGRIANVTTNSFDFNLQEQETTKTAHGEETIAYIAWEPGKGQLAGLPYEVGATSKTITHKWYTLGFQSDFPDTPTFIARMQTTAGGDTSTVRTQNQTATSIEIKIEEEASKDTETNHTKETVGYLAFGVPSATTPETPTEPPATGTGPEKQFTFNWEFPTTEPVIGFRFYLNDTLIAETTNPEDREITCTASLLTEIMQFTMTAILPDGTESTPSTILVVDPSEFPTLFGIYFVTFHWEFDATMENEIKGFTIYNNDIEVCSTSDPATRELTCEIPLDSTNNVFTIKAIMLDGTETFTSNALEYK